jgi:CRP-like cAMP-binding protein
MGILSSYHSNLHPLVRKLDSIFKLTDDEKTALVNLPMQVTEVRADQDVVREGDRPSRSFVVLEGFCCTFKMTGEGKRQIMAFYIPGDMPDLQSLHLPTLDHSVGTLTPCKLGFVQHEVLNDLCDHFPRIGRAFWRETLVDAAIFREWLANVGQRDAYPRIAHLFCEMLLRMRAVGLSDDNSCEFPFTQGEIGDAMGLSNVHVNRTITQLRADSLIEIRGSRLVVPDWEKLKAAGDFDPAYLHLEDARSAA